jgi:carboxypeptidase Q
MKNIFYKQVALFIFLIPFCAISQSNVHSNSDSLFIKQISDDILQNGKSYEWLHQLTKGIGGRLAGSPQFAKAIDWGKKTFESIGVDKVYLQECMVPHWVRNGKDKAVITAVNNKLMTTTLDVLALGNSLGTSNKGVNAEVFAVNDFEQLEANKEKLKGKIVFYNYHFNPTNISTFTSYSDAGKYRWTGASRAAKYGALGVIVRSMSEATDNNPHTGGMEYNDSFPKIPAVAIGLQDADKLWNLTKSASVKINMTTHGKMLPDTIGANVIAELKGREHPEEIISLGGHLDSWDNNEGAHDDGAGVVQTMEVLRVMNALGYHPKHTIRFVLFANEETAGRGAEKYAAVAKEKKEKIIFAFESDAGGFTPRGFSFSVPPTAWTKLNTWKSLFEPYGGGTFTVGGGGADNEPLQEAFKTPVAELTPDSQRYFDIHHARSDVFENVNKRELLLGAVNIAALIYMIDKYGL